MKYLSHISSVICNWLIAPRSYLSRLLKRWSETTNYKLGTRWCETMHVFTLSFLTATVHHTTQNLTAIRPISIVYSTLQTPPWREKLLFMNRKNLNLRQGRKYSTYRNALESNCPKGGCIDTIVGREEPNSNQKEPRGSNELRNHYGTTERIYHKKAIDTKYCVRLSIPNHQLRPTYQMVTKDNHQPLQQGIDERVIGQIS